MRLPVPTPSDSDLVLDKPSCARSLGEEFGVDGWRRQKRSTPRSSMAPDQQEVSPSVWAAMHRCNAFCARVARAWSHRCGAREESAGGLDDTASGVAELTASRDGAFASSLRPLINSATSYRDDGRSLRRGQDQWVARLAVPDLLSA